MSQVKLLFSVHNHQPVGNFDHVIENTYTYSYKPFIDLLYDYPEIKFGLHCSGILWDYFLDKHKDYIDKVREMVKRGQVELISGGYYEPILSSISQQDRIEQIRMMNNFLLKTFDIKSEGLWLTERIWEQNIVKDIVDAGIKYTLVDDYHFYSAGLPKQELNGYYVTEEEGRVLYVFPISQTLRYYIPFKLVDEVINFLKKFSFGHEKEIVGLTLGDDGEKFGGWPKTYEHVFLNNWLKNFLDAVLENKSWLSTITYSEFLKIQPPKGRIYLPTASYFEMGEWTLPTQAQENFEDILKELDNNPNKERYLQFMRGGYWKNFLSKYPESNNMHKKMLFVSEKINKVKKEKVSMSKSKTKNNLDNSNTISELKNIKQATIDLYKAQCNCAYWHGVFGGLYLPHLREAIYEHLIKAEKELYKKDSISILDFDKDGFDEIIVENKDYEVCLKPSYGGSVTEIDLRNYNKNLTNVLSRKKEAYHRRLIEYDKNQKHFDPSQIKTIHDLVLSKEPNLSKHLFYDWYNRYSFLDHFLHFDTKYDNFMRCQYGELGDFVLEPYEVISVDKKNFVVELFREGNVWIGNVAKKVSVKKVFTFTQNIGCDYTITNLSNDDIEVWFLTESNFMVPQPQKKLLGEFESDTLLLKDENKCFSLEIKIFPKPTFWIFPIETISLSESGFERTYQGLSVSANFKKKLMKKESFSFKIVMDIR
ncbi:MAG: alpha-amylase/4-alpha-glucanotransferase domain-containing protein [Endomicrobiia bacterium]